MELVKKTGVPLKQAGDKLSSSDINQINSAVNQSIDAVNQLLKSDCNINQEVGNYNKEFNLENAIASVPKSRRVRGLCIKFLSSESHNYVTCIYQGPTVDDLDWVKTENWEELGFDYIDGGIW